MPPKSVARLCLTLMAAFLPLSQALACSLPDDLAISPFDKDRLQQMNDTQLIAVGEALAAPSASDRSELGTLLAPLQPVTSLPDGEYRCRTIKIGGILPLTVYGFFNCTVSEDGTRIDKTTGSQRFSGDLVPTESGVIYRGALHYGDEQPIGYGANPERDQIGCLVQLAGDTPRYRLDLPAPRFESKHDIIELVPR